jgi:hypothetical protein
LIGTKRMFGRSTASAIASACAETETDLIVMGVRGRNALDLALWIDHAASDPIGSMAHSGRADLSSVANPPEILEPTVIEVGKRAFNSIQWMRPPSLLPPSLLYEY